MPLAHHAEPSGLTGGGRAARRGRNVRALRSVLLTYAMYNFDLGYVQVRGRVLHAQEALNPLRSYISLMMRPDITQLLARSVALLYSPAVRCHFRNRQ